MRNMSHAHKTCGRSLLVHGGMRSYFLFKHFDDRLRRIVSEEKGEIGLVVVDEAAESRNVDFPKVRIHNVLYWQVENLFQKANLKDFLLETRLQPQIRQ